MHVLNCTCALCLFSITTSQSTPEYMVHIEMIGVILTFDIAVCRKCVDRVRSPSGQGSLISQTSSKPPPYLLREGTIHKHVLSISFLNNQTSKPTGRRSPSEEINPSSHNVVRTPIRVVLQNNLHLRFCNIKTETIDTIAHFKTSQSHIFISHIDFRNGAAYRRLRSHLQHHPQGE